MRRIIKKSLAALISAHLMLSPLAFAAEDEGTENKELPANPAAEQTTPEFKDIEIPVESQEYVAYSQ